MDLSKIPPALKFTIDTEAFGQLECKGITLGIFREVSKLSSSPNSSSANDLRSFAENLLMATAKKITDGTEITKKEVKQLTDEEMELAAKFFFELEKERNNNWRKKNKDEKYLNYLYDVLKKNVSRHKTITEQILDPIKAAKKITANSTIGQLLRIDRAAMSTPSLVNLITKQKSLISSMHSPLKSDINIQSADAPQKDISVFPKIESKEAGLLNKISKSMDNSNEVHKETNLIMGEIANQIKQSASSNKWVLFFTIIIFIITSAALLVTLFDWTL